MITSESWLDIVATLGALVDADGHALPAQVSRDGIDQIIVGCDLGNSAIKLVLRQANAPQLRAFRFEAVYMPAAIVRAGAWLVSHCPHQRCVDLERRGLFALALYAAQRGPR